MDGEYGMGAVTIIAHESSRSKRGGSSFRLKAGVLPFPIGDNKSFQPMVSNASYRGLLADRRLEVVGSRFLR
jgi:hypothetical protein